MKHKAHIEDDWQRDGVRIALVTDHGGLDRTLYDFSGVIGVRYQADDSAMVRNDDAPLSLPNDAARALYEALADHFGHGGHDTRALRRDYDAERKRVDLLIDNLTGHPRVVVAGGPDA